MQISWQTCLP